MVVRLSCWHLTIVWRPGKLMWRSDESGNFTPGSGKDLDQCHIHCPPSRSNKVGDVRHVPALFPVELDGELPTFSRQNWWDINLEFWNNSGRADRKLTVKNNGAILLQCLQFWWIFWAHRSVLFSIKAATSLLSNYNRMIHGHRKLKAIRPGMTWAEPCSSWKPCHPCMREPTKLNYYFIQLLSNFYILLILYFA